MEDHLPKEVQSSLCQTRRPSVLQEIPIQVVEHLLHRHYKNGELLPLFYVLLKELVAVGLGLQCFLQSLLDIIFDLVRIYIIQLVRLILLVTQPHDTSVGLHVLLALTGSLLLHI